MFLLIDNELAKERRGINNGVNSLHLKSPSRNVMVDIRILLRNAKVSQGNGE